MEKVRLTGHWYFTYSQNFDSTYPDPYSLHAVPASISKEKILLSVNTRQEAIKESQIIWSGICERSESIFKEKEERGIHPAYHLHREPYDPAVIFEIKL